MPNDIRKKLVTLALWACIPAACCGCRRPNLKVQHMVQPEYPVPARIKNIQGTVELGITIDMDGKVSDVFGSGADPVLIEAAEKNARQWTWGPFPPRFHFPYYQEIKYVYELRGNPKAVVVVPPMVNTDLPDRIEITATRYYEDNSLAPLSAPPGTR
jgi:TonB family protein